MKVRDLLFQNPYRVILRFQFGMLNIPATTITYWDERCGEYSKENENFEET